MTHRVWFRRAVGVPTPSARACSTAVMVMALSLPAFTVGCFNPLTASVLNHVKDRIAPAITIVSPSNGSSYAAAVVVTGTVRDIAGGGTAGRVKELSYQVLPGSLEGKVVVSSDGTFGFQFSTTGLAGSLTVKLTATDWNGNQSGASLTLVDEGAIPSFAAFASDRSVTLTWDPVPLAQSYTLYYEKSDINPSEQYSLSISNVSSPVVVPDLVDGNMHTFLLRAHSSEGEDNWSRVVKAIPLSPIHLAPSLTPQYGGVVVEWNPVPATDEYEVWKASTRDGPYLNISGVIRGHAFLDSAAQSGNPSFYAVTTAAYNGSRSEANAAQSTPFRPRTERVLGSVDTPGSAQRIVVSGSYAYVADNTGGLRVINIGNPATPYEVGHLTLAQPVVDVDVYGDYVYLAVEDANGAAFRVVNVSNRANPVQVGELVDAGNLTDARAVAIGYPYAYVADYWTGLHKIYVSDPKNPVEVGKSGNGYFVCATVTGTRVFVLEDAWSLRVFDTSDITAQLASYNSLSFTEGLAVSGNYAYVAEYWDGLSIFSINGSPLTISKVGNLPTPGDAMGVAVSYPLAFVAEGANGLRIVNVSDPANPREIGSVNTSGDAQDVVIDGTVAWVADGASGVHAIDVSSLTTLTQSGSYAPGPFMSDAALAYPFAYTVSVGGTFRVVDVGSPSSPNPRGSLVLPATSQVVVGGTRAYVADSTTPAVHILDVSDPDHPTEKGSIGISASALAVNGPYLYVVAGELQIFDVSDPSAPREVGFNDSFLDPRGVAVKYPYAYVADYESGGATTGLHIIDISNPKNPTQKGAMTTRGLPAQVSVYGDYAYVAYYWGGFDVFDVSNPATPVLAGSLVESSPRYPSKIVGQGPYLFITDTDGNDLRVFDVSNPANVVPVGSFWGTKPYSVEASGSYAYLVDGFNGLRIVRLGSG